MKIKTGLLSLLLMMGLAGCNLNQDPLHKYPENIRNGTPPDEKVDPEPPKAMSEEVLKIEAADSFTFVEGQTVTEQIEARVLIPHHVAWIEIENLHQFVGASYNPKTGAFRWVPPMDLVEGDYKIKLDLKVVAYTDGVVSVRREKTIPVFVLSGTQAPEILSVEDLTGKPIREGEKRLFRVTVKDLDALKTDKDRPRLEVVGNRSDNLGIAHLVHKDSDTTYVPNPKEVNGNWVFQMYVDLENREVTSSEQIHYFGLVAYSRFGTQSSVKSVPTLIRTSVVAPAVSWGNRDTTMQAGQENTFAFTVFDPKFEGKVVANFDSDCSNLPGKAVCTCSMASFASDPVLCTIRWNIPADTTLNSQVFNLKVTNQSRVSGDTEIKQDRVSKRITILPAPTPPPTPTPAPTPEPTLTPVPEVPPVVGSPNNSVPPAANAPASPASRIRSLRRGGRS